MNSTVLTASCALYRTPLPTEILIIIKNYAFYNQDSVEYAQMVFHKHMTRIWQQIDRAASRKNGFHTLGYNDVNDEHWIFEIEHEPQFEAINCRHCGNYMLTMSWELFLALPERCMCSCDRGLGGLYNF